MTKVRVQCLLLGLASASACNCGAGGLKSANPDIHVAPSTLDFGNVYLRATPTSTFTIFNAGLGSDTVAIAPLADGGPFTLSTSSVPLGAGASVDVSVGYSPTVAGPSTATVQLSWSNGTGSVALTGTALPWPPCDPSSPCDSAAFDPNSGVCTQTPIPDGTACDGGDVCLIATACAGGQCLGMLNPCDDHDACTTDYCVEGEGCHHQDSSSQCDGTDPCQIYACDPVSGCTSSQAPNGTPCSSTESCQTATVCILGACTGVSVPDGTPCALSWAPCVDDATCEAGTCDSPTADAYTPGQPLWHWDAGPLYGQFAVDAVGISYPVTYDADAGLLLSAIDGCGDELWRVPAMSSGNTMLQDGQIFLVGYTDVSAYAAATGAQLWNDTLWALAGFDAGSFFANSGSLSNQGSLSLVGFNDQSVYGSQLLAFYLDGSLSYAQQVPGLGSSPSTLLTDGNGNTYFSSGLICPQSSCTSATSAGSFDATGRLRFLFPQGQAMATTPLAVGADYVLAAQGIVSGYVAASLSAYALDGTKLYDSPLPFYSSAWTIGYGQGAAIDAAGTAYVVGQELPSSTGDSAPPWAIEALDRSGTLSWVTTLPLDVTPFSSPALGDPSTLFIELQGDAGLSLAAFATTTGDRVWQAPAGVAWISPQINLQSLSLSSASELLASDPSGLTAYFANRAVPASGAPWPQAGGDGSNRNCPAP